MGEVKISLRNWLVILGTGQISNAQKRTTQVLRHLTCPQTTKEVRRDALPTWANRPGLLWGRGANNQTCSPKRDEC
jgi:hypothetical protein